MQHTSKKISGFTLIEIMITAVIVGVLAAFAIPKYQDFTETQRAIRAANNLRAVYAAILDYKTNAVMYNSSMQSAPTTGSTLPPGMFQNLQSINETLHLNIPDDPYFSYIAGNSIICAMSSAPLPKDYLLFACPSAGFSPIGGLGVACPNAGAIICIPNAPFSNRCPRGLSPDVIVTEHNVDKIELCIAAFSNFDLTGLETTVEEICQTVYGESSEE